MKKEIIMKGARLLLFPDISLIMQGKKEELKVVGRQGEVHCFFLDCQAAFYKQWETTYLGKCRQLRRQRYF